MTTVAVVVPKIGDGPIHEIVDIADIGTHIFDTNLYQIASTPVLTVPYWMAHWASGAVVEGRWISPAEQIEIDAREAEQAALEQVDKNLAKALDNTVSFFQEKFDLTPAKQTFLDNATTVADLKTVLLDTLSVTPTQAAALQDFRDKYAAWIAAQ